MLAASPGPVCFGLPQHGQRLAQQQAACGLVGRQLPGDELPLQEECQACHPGPAERYPQLHADTDETADLQESVRQAQEGDTLGLRLQSWWF